MLNLNKGIVSPPPRPAVLEFSPIKREKKVFSVRMKVRRETNPSICKDAMTPHGPWPVPFAIPHAVAVGIVFFEQRRGGDMCTPSFEEKGEKKLEALFCDRGEFCYVCCCCCSWSRATINNFTTEREERTPSRGRFFSLKHDTTEKPP